WKDEEESERRRAKREWTKAFLVKKTGLFGWNSFEVVPVLATIHGTAATAAWKICSGGFAALSSLDSGYYGAGIYFTTSAKYAVPYFATKAEPSIIISWVIVGNGVYIFFLQEALTLSFSLPCDRASKKVREFGRNHH